jgi:anti-sigma factor RsiW
MTGLVDTKCRDVVELVTEYLSEALPPEEAARFEQHLFTCPPCAAHLQQMRDLVALAGTLPEPVPAEALPHADAPLEAFRRWKAGRTR